MKLLKVLVGGADLVRRSVVAVLKICTYPIVYIYKRVVTAKWLKRRSSKKQKNNDEFPGIYIVTNSNNTIKIGRSKHVRRRLKSYRGY